MAFDKDSLRIDTNLRNLCKRMTLADIEKMHSDVLECIDERKQDLLKRRGERTLHDMRGLLARAGISMEEFQKALDGG